MLKKSFGALIPLFFLILSCGNPSSPTPSGGRVYKAGDPEPTAPIATDKAFLGWYKSGNFNNIKDRVDFTKKTGGSFQIYPKWADASKYTIEKDKDVLSNVPREIIVEIPYNVNKISVRATKDFPIGNLVGGEATIVTQVYLPGKGLEKIGNRAFGDLKALTSISIPQPVTSIGENSFVNTHALSSVILPEGLITIDNSAFSGSTGLASITIPSTVENINSGAFSGCLSLKSVRVEASTPPAMPGTIPGIPGYQFYSTHTTLSIQVPPGKAKGKTTTIVQDYKATAGWSAYAGKITAYTE